MLRLYRSVVGAVSLIVTLVSPVGVMYGCTNVWLAPSVRAIELSYELGRLRPRIHTMLRRRRTDQGVRSP